MRCNLAPVTRPLSGDSVTEHKHYRSTRCNAATWWSAQLLWMIVVFTFKWVTLASPLILFSVFTWANSCPCVTVPLLTGTGENVHARLLLEHTQLICQERFVPQKKKKSLYTTFSRYEVASPLNWARDPAAWVSSCKFSEERTEQAGFDRNTSDPLGIKKLPHELRKTLKALWGTLRPTVYTTAVSGYLSHCEIKLYFWHPKKICTQFNGGTNVKCTAASKPLMYKPIPHGNIKHISSKKDARSWTTLTKANLSYAAVTGKQKELYSWNLFLHLSSMH